MKNVAIIIRVYDRIDDLELNIHIINSLWKYHNYKIYIVFNGKSDGFCLNNSIVENVEKVIELDQNSGHIKGNSQLLLEGISHIQHLPYDYVIILEADTWLMGDDLIERYISLLDNSSAVWASSEWMEKRYSLGIDLAIIDADFIFSHYKELFDFSASAEMWIAEYIMHLNANFIYISEIMPTHRPTAIKSIYNADGGRLRIFPLANMVSHHISSLKNGMTDKKLYADIAYKNNYFTNKNKFSLIIYHYLYIILQLTLKVLPRSSWTKKKTSRFQDEIKKLPNKK